MGLRLSLADMPLDSFTQTMKKAPLENNELTLYGPYHTFNDGIPSMVKAIPSHIRHLSLEIIRPDRYFTGPTTSLSKTLSAIPATVTQVNLGGNEICSWLDLLQICESLPRTLETVDLSHNALHKEHSKSLVPALQALPPTLKTLILSKNELYLKQGVELAKMLQALRKFQSLSTLDLSDNSLGTNFFKIVFVFGQIPRTVTSLILADCGLENLEGSQLAVAFKLLPNINKLNLSGNSIFTLRELTTAFKAIPETVTELNLSQCGGASSGKTLVTALGAIPRSVTHLNLSNNQLGEMSAEELETALKGIPATVTSLNLSNNFKKAPIDTIKKALLALPSTVKFLDLSDNLFLERSEEDLVQIYDILSRQDKTLNLDDNALWRSLEPSLQALVNYQQNRIKQIEVSQGKASMIGLYGSMVTSPVTEGSDENNPANALNLQQSVPNIASRHASSKTSM